MKKFNVLLCLFFHLSTNAAPPKTNGHAAAPDEWLLGNGMPWHYRMSPASKIENINFREPRQIELPIVNRAKEMLEKSSAKTIALISGNDVVWVGYKYPSSKDSLFLSLSIAKTVTAAAIGKAICAGYLKLNDRADNSIPELKNTDLGSASIGQLLMMASGTPLVHDGPHVLSDQQEIDIRKGSISYLNVLTDVKINQAFRDSSGNKRLPGTYFTYSGIDPLTLGVVLNRTTGMTYAKWVEKMIFHPAGIASRGIVGQDHFGYAQSDGNIRLTLEDWMRFAIWMNNSKNGNDCFSDYLRNASTTKINNVSKISGASFGGYGYLIWTENSLQKNSYWAVGHGGQRIGWNHKNKRMIISFSNVENYMIDLYKLYSDWSRLDEN